MHTPGPWKTLSGMLAGGPFHIVCTVSCERYVAATREVDISERIPNQKLIAAAPALLAALNRVVPWLGRMIADGGHLAGVAPNDAIGALEQAEAAISKAT